MITEIKSLVLVKTLQVQRRARNGARVCTLQIFEVRSIPGNALSCLQVFF